MRSTTFSLLCGASLFAITSSKAHGQTSPKPLRPHIAHVLTADGSDEYRDDRTPKSEDTTFCFIYVGRKQNGPLWLRLQVRYCALKRLNMNQIVFHKGDRSVTINVSKDLLHYDDNGMIPWEWYDTPPSDMEMKVIRAIIREPDVQLTLVGSEIVTRTLSELEREAMQNVLEQARILARGS